MFKISNPEYYLVISKSKIASKVVTLYPTMKRNVLDNSTSCIIFKDLINRVSRVKKLIPEQMKLAYYSNIRKKEEMREYE